MSEFRYGDDNTLHNTDHLDVEIDEEGVVVAVWFRCERLPFRQYRVYEDRVRALQRADSPAPLKAVVFDKSV